jgi:hypothetical protein
VTLPFTEIHEVQFGIVSFPNFNIFECQEIGRPKESEKDREPLDSGASEHVQNLLFAALLGHSS